MFSYPSPILAHTILISQRAFRVCCVGSITVFESLSLIRVNWTNVGERLFTGAWATYQRPPHWKRWHSLQPWYPLTTTSSPGKGRISQVAPKFMMECWGSNFVLVTRRFPQLLCVHGFPDDVTSRRRFQSSPPHPEVLTMFSFPLLPCLLSPGRGDVPFRAEHSAVTFSLLSARLWVSLHYQSL